LDAAKKRTLPPLEAAIPSLGLVLGVLGGELSELRRAEQSADAACVEQVRTPTDRQLEKRPAAPVHRRPAQRPFGFSGR
jgi:hypothetical protein